MHRHLHRQWLNREFFFYLKILIFEEVISYFKFILKSENSYKIITKMYQCMLKILVVPYLKKKKKKKDVSLEKIYI